MAQNDMEIVDKFFRVLRGTGTGDARYSCMAGEIAAEVDQQRGPQAPLSPVAGEVCRRILYAAAQDQVMNSERLHKSPFEGLYGVYDQISRAKNLPETQAAIKNLVNEYASYASGVNQNATSPVKLPTPAGAREPLVLTPGVAYDAGFTKVWMDYLDSGHKPQAPQAKDSDMLIARDDCVRNMGITAGKCYVTGKIDGALSINSGFAALSTPPVSHPGGGTGRISASK